MITPLFKKLNLKPEMTELLVVNAPASFEPELAALGDGVTIHRDPAAVASIPFALSFVTKQDEVDALAAEIGAKAEGDATIWFAYPKASSKRYTCEFNRDTGWAAVGEAGFEGVRQVAIDEDWSALRFRRPAYIKSMKRQASTLISEEGRQKAADQDDG